MIRRFAKEFLNGVIVDLSPANKLLHLAVCFNFIFLSGMPKTRGLVGTLLDTNATEVSSQLKKNKKNFYIKRLRADCLSKAEKSQEYLTTC